MTVLSFVSERLTVKALTRAGIGVGFFFAAEPLFAQQAVVFGTITDSSKGVLPGVTVTITNQNTGLKEATVTNDQGEYRRHETARIICRRTEMRW
jgi:hypothetical protein